MLSKFIQAAPCCYFMFRFQSYRCLQYYQSIYLSIYFFIYLSIDDCVSPPHRSKLNDNEDQINFYKRLSDYL